MWISPVTLQNQSRLNNQGDALNNNSFFIKANFIRIMKSLVKAFFLVLSTALFLAGCNDSESGKKPVCLPTQFPLEEDDGIVKATYDAKNKIYQLTYTYEGDDQVFSTVHSYDKKGRVSYLNFYVNYHLAEDFVQVLYSADTIHEEFFRTTALPENLTYYRIYYLTDKKVTSFTEYDSDNDFARGDSTVFEYTGKNVTTIKFYDEDGILQSTAHVEFDDKPSPYFKTGFSGEIYQYSYLNLSENNPVKYTLVELGEDIIYTYTYKDNGLPMSRESTIGVTIGEFTYTCDDASGS